LLRKQQGETISRLAYESSSAFTLFWNRLRNQLPEEVIEDFDAWLQRTQMVRMDTMGSQDSVRGAYTVKCGDDPFVFHDVEMPPPSGAVGVNYTRFVNGGYLHTPV
jgi:hypothetical protein